VRALTKSGSLKTQGNVCHIEVSFRQGYIVFFHNFIETSNEIHGIQNGLLQVMKLHDLPAPTSVIF